MMKYKMQLPVKLLKQGEPGFTFTVKGGTGSYHRASIKMDESCPVDVRHIVQKAIFLGWIEPVAMVKDEELMWDLLSDISPPVNDNF